MGISHYIREIGRGREGARALSREQAADLFGQVLDGAVSDLEVGAFCLAMRIKGETAQEMAGFLDAAHQRLNRIPLAVDNNAPVVVVPSYNGARKLPALTPMLALLLARQGASVLIHGTATESSRVFTSEILQALGIAAQISVAPLQPGQVMFVPTAVLCPGLQTLLEVRRKVGLRNPAHSLVKLMNPVAGPALIVSSYTHPEYAKAMAEVFELTQANAMLLRGTEGESVADARRMPQMEGFIAGQRELLQTAQTGTLASLPELPAQTDAASTAAYIQKVLAGHSAVPGPIATQVEHILRLIQRITAKHGQWV
jgi:anthranilate phosphoribosyltransferase